VQPGPVHGLTSGPTEKEAQDTEGTLAIEIRTTVSNLDELDPEPPTTPEESSSPAGYSSSSELASSASTPRCLLEFQQNVRRRTNARASLRRELAVGPRRRAAALV
jgi:hypothetical protein